MNKYRASAVDRWLKQDEDFRDLYNEVGEQATVRIRSLGFKKKIESKNLVDPELWGEDNALHRLIGQIIAHQVTHGRLKLRFLSCPLCTCKLYERI